MKNSRIAVPAVSELSSPSLTTKAAFDTGPLAIENNA